MNYQQKGAIANGLCAAENVRFTAEEIKKAFPSRSRLLVMVLDFYAHNIIKWIKDLGKGVEA